MKLYTYRKPLLPAGCYQISAEQTVTAGNDQRKYETGMKLYVRYPRFTIEDTEIYEIYPPEGGTGQYDRHLPFIQFYKNTLPWMRGDGKVPWMALFVLEETDGAVQTQGTLKNFFAPGADTAMMDSRVETDNEEKETDPCTFVDIPAERFRELAPTYEELELLAHVRQFDCDNKAEGEKMPEGALSCLISNQYITETSDRILLVSVEGMEDILKDPSGLSDYRTVRLPVLKEWRVSHAKEHKSFGDLLKQLDVGVLGADAGDGPLKKGFIPIQYIDRAGNRLISWYHGPFVGAKLGALSGSTGEDADQYLRFDPELAMFDVSYSAAYQLGQLLAMNHMDVVREFSELRKGVRRQQRVQHQMDIFLRHRSCSESEMLMQLIEELEE